MVGETRLRQLDHLVRHPVTLAYLLIDGYERQPDPDRRATAARQVRQLLANARQQHQPVRRRRPWQSMADGLEERRRRHPIVAAAWQPIDDALAFLAIRDLLRVAPVNGSEAAESGEGALVFGVTMKGRALLRDSVYPSDRDVALYLQICEILLELTSIPPGLPGISDAEGALADLLEKVERRLTAFRRDAQIPFERDPLPELFRLTFRERL